MDIAMAASRSLSPEISVAAPKPILRGIHRLALVTDNMRMTLDFYVRVLGMPIVHGLRTPSRPAGTSHAHGNGAPPHWHCHGNYIEHVLRAKARHESCRGDRISPLCRRFGSEDPQRRSGDEMALNIEGIVNCTVHAEKPLGGSS
jgi:Glyoxalase/Bleomycin resistance protein/Dioxygenase superfamily